MISKPDEYTFWIARIKKIKLFLLTSQLFIAVVSQNNSSAGLSDNQSPPAVKGDSHFMQGQSFRAD